MVRNELGFNSAGKRMIARRARCCSGRRASEQRLTRNVVQGPLPSSPSPSHRTPAFITGRSWPTFTRWDASWRAGAC